MEAKDSSYEVLSTYFSEVYSGLHAFLVFPVAFYNQKPSGTTEGIYVCVTYKTFPLIRNMSYSRMYSFFVYR